MKSIQDTEQSRCDEADGAADTADDDSYQAENDGLLHSNVHIRSDASHMSAISGNSATVYTEDESTYKNPLSVLEEGEDDSLFDSRSGSRSRSSKEGESRSRSRASYSDERSRHSSVESGKISNKKSFERSFQEVKDDAAGTIASRRSSDPEGDYQPQLSTNEGKYTEAMKMRKDAVEKYSSVARKKASLMTNHNFEREGVAGSRSSRSSRSENRPRAREEERSPPKSSPSPPPPPFAYESVNTFVGRSVAPDDASSVSSMTSMDSYLKQQYILRELERLKAREAAREKAERDEARQSCRGGESRRGGSGPDGSRRSSYHHDEREHQRSSSYQDNREARRSSYRDDRDKQSRRSSYDQRASASRSKSRSFHSDDRPRRRLSAIGESTRSRSCSRSTSTRSDARHEKSFDDCDHPKSARSSVYTKSAKSTKCSSGNTVKSKKSISMYSQQSHSTSHTPPLHQLEECCIKHPHILLSDQTNVNVWTCMRYCKDERTGRWVTKKKVCEACLEEEEEYSRREPTSSRYGKSYNESSSFDERTTSVSSSEDGFSDNAPNSNTVNVYGDDGNQTPLEREAEAQRRRFIRRLAARACHFPGNTWYEDWTQYIKNTHLVFGIFFHHPLHPVTSRERCIILLGSVAVGLLLSNLIYLWFVHYNIGVNDSVIHLYTLDVTKLMITLWTFGSFAHTIFDLSVWHIKACTLCRYGGEVSDAAVRCGRRSVSVGVQVQFTRPLFHNNNLTLFPYQ
jgi:hypothetical protein